MRRASSMPQRSTAALSVLGDSIRTSASLVSSVAARCRSQWLSRFVIRLVAYNSGDVAGTCRAGDARADAAAVPQAGDAEAGDAASYAAGEAAGHRAARSGRALRPRCADRSDAGRADLSGL